MELTRDICFFDIEATGVDPVTDRIVSIALCKVTPADMLRPAQGSVAGFECHEAKWFRKIVNPGIKMKPEVIRIHGITNEIAAKEPLFKEIAPAVHELIKGCDLGTYNGLRFDVTMLIEELARAGIEWDPTTVNIIDVANIFCKKHPRNLTACYKIYTGKEMKNAHTDTADVMATMEAFFGQLKVHPDLGEMTIEQLGEFSKMEGAVDLAGKLIRNEDGVVCFNIRPQLGVPVADDPGFAAWMLGRDFPSNTKAWLRKIMDETPYGSGGQEDDDADF